MTTNWHLVFQLEIKKMEYEDLLLFIKSQCNILRDSQGGDTINYSLLFQFYAPETFHLTIKKRFHVGLMKQFVFELSLLPVKAHFNSAKRKKIN